MKIIIILIYIIIFILLINFSINIEKYTNIEINKLKGINMYGNLTIKTKKNNFDNINKICIKNKCINIDKLNKLPIKKGISGQCTVKDCTKVCKCPYGIAASGEDCKVHEKEICTSCGKNYRFDSVTKKCIACEGGKFINKENHIREICCSETENYNTDNTCSKKTCKCNNGEPDNENCEDEKVTKCKNCNKDYYLDNNQCEKCPSSTFTKDGNRDRECCPRGQHYDSIRDGCFTNKCTCNGGYPAEGEDCLIHGAENCASCKGGITKKFFSYSPSIINGNKCIDCKLDLEGSYGKLIYSNKHRITKCCPWNHIYNEDNNRCEDNENNSYNNLCRNGEIFNYSGYCECPDTKYFDLTENICKCPQGKVIDPSTNKCV